MFKLVAIADGLIFDEAYCRNMKLPFNKGWDQWAVYRIEGRNLMHVRDFDDFGAAEAFITYGSPAATTITVPDNFVHH